MRRLHGGPGLGLIGFADTLGANGQPSRLATKAEAPRVDPRGLVMSHRRSIPMNLSTSTTDPGPVAQSPEPSRGLPDPFSLFAAEWTHAGMPGEPRSEPDGTASVVVESLGVRVFYRPLSAVAALNAFLAAERATNDDEAAMAEALGKSIGCAVERYEFIEGAESRETGAPADPVAQSPEPPRGLLDPFSLFAEEWKRVGMPGEPQCEPDGTASVAVEFWGVRVFYHPLHAVAVLQSFPAAEEAADEDVERMAESLGESFGGAVERSEPLDGEEISERTSPHLTRDAWILMLCEAPTAEAAAPILRGLAAEVDLDAVSHALLDRAIRDAGEYSTPEAGLKHLLLALRGLADGAQSGTGRSALVHAYGAVALSPWAPCPRAPSHAAGGAP